MIFFVDTVAPTRLGYDPTKNIETNLNFKLLSLRFNCNKTEFRIVNKIMVKPIMLAVGAIPVIVALLIAIPLITKPDIPFSAANPNDTIRIEYTKHQLKKISFGVTDDVKALKTEILLIKNNGEIEYSVTKEGYPQPQLKSKLSEKQIRKLTALIKETGFIEIPTESFPVKNNVSDYQKSNVKIILNGQIKQIHWPEQNATEKFIPPIITMVEFQLDEVINQISE